MPTAFVRYRSGGGFQKVNEYTRVFDSRKLMERGYYRDSGFLPMAVPAESATFDKEDMKQVTVGSGSNYQLSSGTLLEVEVGVAGSPPPFSVKQPDELSHTSPRQLSWNETILTFANDSSTSATFTASNSSSRTLITVADALLFSGKAVSFSGADLPSALYPNQLYYATAISATTLLLQTSIGSDYVAWGDAGTGTQTIAVVDVVAEFPWANILGWSDTAPTR